jgi:hypothetical protein
LCRDKSDLPPCVKVNFHRPGRKVLFANPSIGSSGQCSDPSGFF